MHARAALAVLAILTMALPHTGSAQPPRLTMTVSSAELSPGETIVVTIESPARESFRGVMLIGQNPIGMVGSADALPAKFALKIPDALSSGKYGLTAMAVTPAGEELMAVVELAVDRPDLPTSIAARYPRAPFFRQGDQLPIDILANYAKERNVDITNSGQLTFRTLDPRVAIVDEARQLQAIGPGTTSVIATLAHPKGQRQTTMTVIVPPPPFRVTPNPLDFGTQAIGNVASAKYTITNTMSEPLKIVKVGTFADDFAATDGCVSASPLAPGESCTIAATFTPLRIGYSQVFIRVETGDNEYGLSLSGTGAAPAKRD